MSSHALSITKKKPGPPENGLRTRKQGSKGRTGSRNKTGSSNKKNIRDRGPNGAHKDPVNIDPAQIRNLLLNKSTRRDGGNGKGPRQDSTGTGRTTPSKETRLFGLERKHPPEQTTVAKNQHESKAVPGPSAFESSRNKAIRELQSRIDRNKQLLKKPENQLPDFKPGQGIITTAYTRDVRPLRSGPYIDNNPSISIGSEKYYQFGQTIAYEIEEVDQKNKKAKLYSERYGSSWVTFSELGKWLDFRPNKIGNKYTKEQTVTELRSSADLFPSVKRVPRRADKIHAQLIRDVQLLHHLKLEKKLGHRRTRTFNMLMARYQNLSREYSQQVTKLMAWREKNGGFTSMRRLGYGIYNKAAGGEFVEPVNNPELFNGAPQRARMETLAKAMKETRNALEQVIHNQPLTVSPGVDPELSKIALAAKSDTGRLSMADALKVNKSFLKEAAASGHVGDAWLAYHATVQPYLNMKTKQGESFHRTADGKASLTFAINQAIQKKVMGDRKLALTSADLERLRPEIEDNWERIHGIKDDLNKQHRAPADWAPPFDKKVIDAEIARLKRIEQSEGHKQLSDIVSPETINPKVDQIISKEPSWVSRFGNGVLKILDDPETWAMVAVGAATMGSGSAVILGRSAVSVGRLAHLYRQGALTYRSAGLFTASTMIDSAAFHTGMNLFNMARGKSERADWGADAYARSFVLMSAIYGANARHMLRQMQMSPAIHRRILEQGRYFGEEAAAITTVGLGEALLRNGNLKGAWQQLEHNAQFLLAMRIIHGGRKLWPKKAEGRFLEARDAFIRKPSADRLGKAFEALRAFENGLKESLAPKAPELTQLNPMQRGKAVTDYMRNVMDAVEAGRVNGGKGGEQALHQLHGWARSAFMAENKGRSWDPSHRRAFVELNTRLESLKANQKQSDSATPPPSGRTASSGRTAKQNLPTMLYIYNPGGGGGRRAVAMGGNRNPRDDVANKDGEPRSPWATAGGNEGGRSKKTTATGGRKKTSGAKRKAKTPTKPKTEKSAAKPPKGSTTGHVQAQREKNASDNTITKAPSGQIESDTPMTDSDRVEKLGLPSISNLDPLSRESIYKIADGLLANLSKDGQLKTEREFALVNAWLRSVTAMDSKMLTDDQKANLMDRLNTINKKNSKGEAASPDIDYDFHNQDGKFEFPTLSGVDADKIPALLVDFLAQFHIRGEGKDARLVYGDKPLDKRQMAQLGDWIRAQKGIAFNPQLKKENPQLHSLFVNLFSRLKENASKVRDAQGRLSFELPLIEIYNSDDTSLVMRHFLDSVYIEQNIRSSNDLNALKGWIRRGTKHLQNVRGRTELPKEERKELTRFYSLIANKFNAQILEKDNIDGYVPPEQTIDSGDTTVLDMLLEEGSVSSPGAQELKLKPPNIDFIPAHLRGRLILHVLEQVKSSTGTADPGQTALFEISGGRKFTLSAEQVAALRDWAREHMAKTSHAWILGEKRGVIEAISALDAVTYSNRLGTPMVIGESSKILKAADSHFHLGDEDTAGSYEPLLPERRHSGGVHRRPIEWLFSQLDRMDMLTPQSFFSVSPYLDKADARKKLDDPLGYYAKVDYNAPFDGVFKRFEKQNPTTGEMEPWYRADAVVIHRPETDASGEYVYDTDIYGVQHLRRTPVVFNRAFEISEQNLCDQLGISADQLPGTGVVHWGYTGTHHCALCYANQDRELAIAEDLLDLPKKHRQYAYMGIVSGNPYNENGWRTAFDQFAKITALEAEKELSGGGPDGDIKVGDLNIVLGEITFKKEIVGKKVARPDLFTLDGRSFDNAVNYLKKLTETGGTVIVHADIGNALSMENRWLQLPNDNANFSDIQRLFRRLPHVNIIWAHGGGMGRFVMPTRDHVRMLDEFLSDPTLAHVKIDFSWDVINKYMLADRDTMRQWANLVKRHPKRFLWGSDSVGVSEKTGIGKHFSGFEMMRRAGFFDEVAKGSDALDRLLSGNFNDTIIPGAKRVSTWRKNPIVREWLRRRGFEKNLPNPAVWAPVVDADGKVKPGVTELRYNIAYFKARYGPKWEEFLRAAQERQPLPVFEPIEKNNH